MALNRLGFYYQKIFFTRKLVANEKNIGFIKNFLEVQTQAFRPAEARLDEVE